MILLHVLGSASKFPMQDGATRRRSVKALMCSTLFPASRSLPFIERTINLSTGCTLQSIKFFLFSLALWFFVYLVPSHPPNPTPRLSYPTSTDIELPLWPPQATSSSLMDGSALRQLTCSGRAYHFQRLIAAAFRVREPIHLLVSFPNSRDGHA